MGVNIDGGSLMDRRGSHGCIVMGVHRWTEEAPWGDRWAFIDRSPCSRDRTGYRKGF